MLSILVPVVLGSATQFTVASSGIPKCTIVVDPHATLAVHQGARELAGYLSQITGAKLPFVESTQPPPGPCIFVGSGAAEHSRFGRINLAKMGEEQTIVTGNGNNLLVAGGEPRGTIYSVYRLLDRLGVKWWTPWATDVPSNPNLTISTATVMDAPVLEYRDASFHSEFNPQWAAHNYCNEGELLPELGSGVVYEGFVHTYYGLIPPEKYFASHPEWFSLINGKRTTDNAQLCTTNPELRKEVLKQVLERLRKNPHARIVSVSQNDCFNPCQCPVCQALVKEQGSDSAPVIALANYVADGIKKEFPKVAVDTLAYQWSRHAPKTLKPLPNVIVRLCSIECDFGSPLNAPKNASFSKDVLDWSRLTHRLYVWDYVTNFANYLLPMPDDGVLGPNLNFLASNGVKGVFEEGDYTSNGGAMSNLKAWMLSRLLWNPAADGKELRSEFTAGYFGSASAPIDVYLQLMDDEAAKAGCTIYQDANASYLTPSLVLQSELLWQEAEKRVSGDSDKLWRVKEAHLPIQFVILKRWDELKAYASANHTAWPISSEKSAYANAWLKAATTPGPAGWEPITAISEDGLSPKAFIDSVVK